MNHVVGQMLTAEDLQLEQDCHRSMRYHQNRLHGRGVIDGFGVAIGDDGIHVGPGMAIDGLGRELVLTEPCCVRLDDDGRVREVDVLAVWREAPERTVPGPDGEELVTVVVERPEVVVVALEQRPPDAVRLARLVLGESGEATIDDSVCDRHPLAVRSSAAGTD